MTSEKNTSEMAKKNETENRKLQSRLRSFFDTASYKRLKATIGPFEQELETLIARGSKDKETEPWVNNAKANVECAKQALKKYEVQSGWNHLYDAQCASTHLLRTDDGSLENCAKGILNESEEKLEGWRKETVRDLLCKDGKLKTGSSLLAGEVYEAQRILTGHHGNTYIKLDTAHKQLEILAIGAVLLVPLCIISLTYFSGQIAINNLFLLVSVALFGAMGGIASGMITVARRSTKGKIPNQLLNSWSTISKPIFGAVAALALSMFLLAGLIQLGSLTNYLILAVSFVAGFSERFLLRAVEATGSASSSERK